MDTASFVCGEIHIVGLVKDRHYTRIFFKRKLINYTKNELQGINPFVLPNLEPKCAPGDPIL